MHFHSLKCSVLPLLLLLILLALVAPLTAQGGGETPTLREAPAGEDPQRHLLKTIYEAVKYPAKAREARRGGPYLLSISVDASGASWEATPLTTQTEAPGAINLVVVAADNTQGAPVSGQMKVNADRALLEETERIGRYLVDIGFDPAVRQDAPVADTLNLVFYYRIEE